MTRPLTLRLVPRPRLRMSDAPRAALTCRVLPVFGSAAVAQDAATRAAASEAAAQISAAAASVSEGAAAVSATSSAGSANAAATSASAAAGSAATATTRASEAAASASTASTKAGEAAASASAAAGSAATATTKANEAAASASTASTKAGEAAASASAAAGSAANAAATLAGAVRHDIAQTLTAPQQAQARTNIGVISGGWSPSAADRYQYSTGAGLAVEGIITPAARELVGSVAVGDLVSGTFVKADPYSVAFLRTANGAISLKAGTTIGLAGLLYRFAADTAVQMPTLTTGADYAIYICNDGTLRADASFTAPTGFTTTTSRRIGGFHYAPGGNAPAQAGGDTTPQINPYSLWDLRFRPACPDPRGMTLVAGGFWCDIYLLGVDHIINGTSRYNVTIADGASPPKIPSAFGGNGSATYSAFTWLAAAEVLAAYGKQLMTYDEFAAAAYGTTEASSAESDPVSTILRAAYTSRWGVMLATGNMWAWGRNFGGGSAAAGWANNAGGRGQTYQGENVATYGGDWSAATYSGSRCSNWSIAPSYSGALFGARGRCDHLCQV